MPKSFPLQSLLDLSQLRLDEATRRLGELIAGQQEATQRLELLIQYREEYHARFLSAAQAGISREAWQNFRTFLDRLDVAVDQARAMVAASERNTAAGQRAWLDKRGKVKAFDTLSQRHRARLDHAAYKQEQKSGDEHSARKHRDKEDGEG